MTIIIIIIITIITTERKTWNNNIILNLSNYLFYFYFHLLFWRREDFYENFHFHFWIRKFSEIFSSLFGSWKFSLLDPPLGFENFHFQFQFQFQRQKYLEQFSDFENFHFQKKIRKFSEKFFTYKIIWLKIFYFHQEQLLLERGRRSWDEIWDVNLMTQKTLSISWTCI